MHHPYDIALLTIAASLGIGILCLIIAKKLKFSPIVLLLISGVLCGPQFLNLIDPNNLSSGLQTIISFAVAIILFEGGLTLDYSGYKKASSVILRLLSIGVLITWILASIVLYFLFSFPLAICLLAASLIIVTGPTVIAPLVRRINVNFKLTNILHWEGVLIDPIGVFIAIFMFALVQNEAGDKSILSNSIAYINLFKKIIIGFSIGFISGFSSLFLLRKKILPSDTLNPFILTIAIVTFGLSDYFIRESGILAVVVSGFIIGLGNKRIGDLENLKKFKIDLTYIFICLIFILLAANLDLSKLNEYSWQWVVVIVAVFLIRFCSIFLSTINDKTISFREKLFLSWIAPRGIIAASMATLFTINLKENPNLKEYAWFIETFTFLIIGSTIIIQGLSANVVAKILKVKENKKQNWIIVGMNLFTEKIYHFLTKNNQKVTVLDTNKNLVSQYQNKKINIICQNALDFDIFEQQPFLNVGRVIAMTDNSELNTLLCQHWQKIVDKKNVFSCSCGQELMNNSILRSNRIWSFLPSASTISQELKNDRSILLEKNKPLKEKSSDILPLFFIDKGGNIFPFESEKQILKDIKKILYLKRNIISHFENLKMNNIFYLNEKSILAVYKNLIKESLKKKPLNKDRINREVKEQIGQANIVFKKKIVICRYYSNKISFPLIYLAILEKPIFLKDYNCDIYLCFFLIIPKGDYSQYISIIEKINTLVDNSKKFKSIVSSSSKKEVLQLIG